MNVFRKLIQNRRTALGTLLFTVVLCTSGCEIITKLRAIFHPEDVSIGTGGSCSIELLIQPSTNIEVFLDGEPVATESPYIARELKAEKHQLHIESEGFHPFSLIFELAENKKLSLPIALRKKSPSPSLNGKGGTLGFEKYDRAPSTGAGIRPAKLAFGTSPPETIRWDGEVLDPPQATLNRRWGTLQAGPLRIKYRYNEVGILEFSIPREEAKENETISWLKGRSSHKAGESFRVPKGTTQLIRISTLTGRQILTIERP